MSDGRVRRDRIVMIFEAWTNFGKERDAGQKRKQGKCVLLRSNALCSENVKLQKAEQRGSLATERGQSPDSRWTKVLLRLDCDF
jgi:hypothetical protein